MLLTQKYLSLILILKIKLILPLSLPEPITLF